MKTVNPCIEFLNSKTKVHHFIIIHIRETKLAVYQIILQSIFTQI